MIPSINPWDAEVEVFEQLTLVRLLKHAEPEGECLEWTGHANDGRHPQVKLGGRKGRVYNVRRVLWVLLHGSIPANRQVGLKCPCELCVHPDHLVLRTRSAAMKRVKKSLLSARRMAATKRAKSRLTEDMVSEIRSSSKPAIWFDRSWRLGNGTASNIRRGRSRRDFSADMLGGMR
ncbi:hypothetical protein [Variovorax paradoxus]|uniref:hypothetical protein n=1 Tax=Variovorax paradoxus TaxID=34073 RepID=UPI0029C634D2|nr:hypothetical protein [Variovorax paradoxus]WPH22294.1 hypothetical protein RZE78_09050 [Variovorax paradoxus]